MFVMQQEKIKYSEFDLVTRLKNRSSDAFEYLYDNYSAALYSLVLTIVPEKELADDTLQEIFIKIWRQIDSYDETKGKLFTWLINLSRNASIDALRSKGYRNSKQNHELTDYVHDIAGGSQININQIGLKKLVSNLEKDYRILIELSYFQGYTQDEISKMLQIPLGTVKTRLRTAIIQLRGLV